MLFATDDYLVLRRVIRTSR